VQSALGGFAILVLAVMAKYVMNRLWQKTLLASAADALASAESHGLVVHRLGFGPCVRATGVVAGQTVAIEWRGGIRGEISRCRLGGRRMTVPLIRTSRDLACVLLGEE